MTILHSAHDIATGAVVGTRRSPRTYTHAIVLTDQQGQGTYSWHQTEESARKALRTLAQKLRPGEGARIVAVVRNST